MENLYILWKKLLFLTNRPLFRGFYVVFRVVKGEEEEEEKGGREGAKGELKGEEYGYKEPEDKPGKTTTNVGILF